MRAGNDAGWSGWTNSPAAGPYTPPAPDPTPTPTPEPPGAPTGLTATAGDGSATMAWNDPGDASITGYRYQIQEDGGDWGGQTPIAGSGAGTTSHEVTGLVNGSEYQFKLQALNADGASPAAQAQVSLPALLPGPANVTITRGTGTLTASWTAVPGAWSYWIYSDNSSDGYFVRKSEGYISATTITLTGVNDTLNYRVALYARTDYGKTEWVVTHPAGTLNSPPIQPASVTVSRSGGKLVASWPAVVGAASYNVNISGDRGKTWARQTSNHTGTTWTVNTIDADTDYVIAVQTRNNVAVSGWTNSPVNTPEPPAPASVTVTSRSGATLNVSWAAVTGATSYNVRSSADNGATWSASSGVTTGTTTTLALDATKDYVVGAQAVNAKGTSDWTVSSVSYATPLPAAPTNVAATRAKGSVTLTWDAVSGASSYDVACNQYTVSYTWKICKSGVTDANRTATVTTYYNPHTKSMRPIVDTRSYLFAVRARNNSGAGEWTRLTVWPAAPLRIASISAARTASDITLTWTAPAANGGYPITYVFVQCRTSSDGGTTWSSWFNCAGQSSPSYVPGSLYSAVIDSVDGYDSALTYQARARGYNALGYGDWRESAVIEPVTLTASAVTATTATLTLDGHTGNWWLKQTAPTPAGTCTAGESDFSHALSALTGGTWYTYRAYRDSGCATELASATFTAPVTVSSLDNGRSDTTLVGYQVGAYRKAAAQFTTGGYSNGYALSSVTIKIDDYFHSFGTPGDLTVAIYSNGSGGKPNTLVTTLTGSNPTGAGQLTYRCTSSCSLSAGASYHVLLEAPNASPPNSYYGWESSNSSAEVQQPSGNGWSIGESFDHRNNAWSDLTLYFKFQVTATPNPSLDPSSVTATTATLTLANHTGDWWLKQTAPTPAGTCTAGESDFSHALSNLTGGAAYTYKAYRDAGCATEIASATFSTLSLTAGSITDTTATLTIANHTGNWYVKQTAPSAGSCSSVITGTTHDLSALTANTSYTYKAYRDNGCATEIASATFTTLSLTAGSVTTTTATLTIANHTGNWYVKQTAPSSGSCSSVITGTTHDLSALTAGAWHTYRAYGVSGCADADELATAVFSAAVAVSSLSEGNAHTSSIGYASGGQQTRSQAFTTGSNPGGYTLSSVSVMSMAKRGNPASFVVKLHAASGNHPGTELATLSGDDPDTAGTHAYTCSGAGCALAANTTYHVAMSAPNSPTGTNAYEIRMTHSDNETNTPSSGDWSIANSTWRGNINSQSAFKMQATALPRPSLIAGSVTDTTATLTLTGRLGDWWLKETSPATGTCTAGEADYSHALSGLTAGLSYTYKAYSDSACTTELFSATFTTLTLTAGSVATTTATLTIANHTGNWYVKQTAPTAGTCSSAISGNTHDLSALTAGAWHTYRAYGASGCADASELAAAVFSAAVAVSNLSAGNAHTNSIGYASGGQQTGSQAFTTGSNPEGYTLSSVSVMSMAKRGNPESFVVKLHAASGNHPGTELSTLSGDDPDTAGTHAYTCSGAGCALAANTTYHVAMSAPNSPSGTNAYEIRMTNSDNETNTPSSGDWSIANSTWRGNINSQSAFKIQATALPRPSLIAGSVTGTTATLTLTGRLGDWWLKETSPATGTCTSGEADYSHALSGLTAGVSYTYKAYSDSACTTELFSTTFTTLSLTAGSVATTTATLTLANHTGNWYVKQTAPTAGTCSSAITGKTHDLSALTAGAWYTYRAYGANGCADASELAAAVFSAAVTVSNLSPGSAGTLSIGYASGGQQTGSQAFTTGSNPGGYTLSSVSIASAAKRGNPASFVVKLHAASGDNPGTELATLSGDDPDTTGTHAYTCSGAGCALAANTTYHVAMSAPNSPSGTNAYEISMTHSNEETNTPSSGDWSIANGARIGNYTSPAAVKMQVAALPKPSLIAGGVTVTTATLTLTGHLGDWWLKETSPATGTCTAGEADYSHALSSLTAGAAYTYKAYRASGCASADEITGATFTTPVTVSSLGNARNGHVIVGKSFGNQQKTAARFTAGSNSGGYNLSSVTIEFDTKFGTTGDLTVAIYSNDNSGKPDTLATTLTGSNPTGAGQFTYRCAASCSLTADTSYHVVLEAPDAVGANDGYSWETSSANTQVKQPLGNGWSIGKSYKHTHTSWSEESSFFKFQVAATPK